MHWLPGCSAAVKAAANGWSVKVTYPSVCHRGAQLGSHVPLPSLPGAVARQSENNANIPEELGPAGADVASVGALLDGGRGVVPRAALILASIVAIREPKEADTAVCTDWLTSS